MGKLKWLIVLIIFIILIGLAYAGYNYVIEKCGSLSPLDMLRCIFLR